MGASLCVWGGVGREAGRAAGRGQGISRGKGSQPQAETEGLRGGGGEGILRGLVTRNHPHGGEGRMGTRAVWAAEGGARVSTSWN